MPPAPSVPVISYGPTRVPIGNGTVAVGGLYREADLKVRLSDIGSRIPDPGLRQYR